MKVETGFAGRERALTDLFATTFAASEGSEEGALIGGLVRDLFEQTSKEDIRVFSVDAEGTIIGAAVFTRLIYPEDPTVVFLLSPMAVAPDYQGKGVGQALLRHALKALDLEGVQVAMTYGDPNFYGRVGFSPVTVEHARPPLPLSMPHGWIGRSLTESSMPALLGPSICVSALNRSDIW
jgi:putative acetyltransferase